MIASAGGIPSSDGAVDDGMRSISGRARRVALYRCDATIGIPIEADRMPPREPSCSRILPPSARDFPIIPGESGTISERDSQFESASLQRRVACEPEFLDQLPSQVRRRCRRRRYRLKRRAG